MMSREHELMRMICEQPGDDAPRLILADAWEERGLCDRAEFVRVGCELAAMGPKPRSIEGVHTESVGNGQWRMWNNIDFHEPMVGERLTLIRPNLIRKLGCRRTLSGLVVAKMIVEHDDFGEERSWLLKPDGWPKWNGRRWKELANRNHELLDRWGGKWKAELDHEMCAQFPGRLWEWGDWGRWSRGFINGVACTPKTFVRVAKYLFAFAPIEQVTLRGITTTWEPGDVWISDTHLPEGATVLPRKIVRHLEYGSQYASEISAFADMNQACVAFGREEARLPELASGDRVNV